jgi:hypothetical protein
LIGDAMLATTRPLVNWIITITLIEYVYCRILLDWD